jgi:hypothetical protein
MARILNTKMVSRVLIYTVDRDADDQDRTGMKTETDWQHWASDTVVAMVASHVLTGTRWGGTPVGYPRWVWLLWLQGDVASSFCLP